MKKTAIFSFLFITIIMIGIVLTGCGSGNNTGINSASDLNNSSMTIGYDNSNAVDDILKEKFPNSQKMDIALANGVIAVQQGKADAYLDCYYALKYLINTGTSGVKILNEQLEDHRYVGAGISKSSKINGLKDKIDSAITALKKDGTIDEMTERWLTNGDYTMPDIDKPKNSDYTIVIGTCGIKAPFSYYSNNTLSGFDIELGERIGAYLNANVEFKVADYAGLYAGLNTGKYDIVLADLYYTEERAESVSYSEFYLDNPVYALVRSDSSEPVYCKWSRKTPKNLIY